MPLRAALVLFVWSIGQLSAQSFTPTGSMPVTRDLHTATLLDNGLVLITGGYIDETINGITNSAELYDPKSGTWRYTGIVQQSGMNSARVYHTATKLADGRVLIAGGIYAYQLNSGVGGYTALWTGSAEIFDPATETFTSTGSLNVGRFDSDAVALNDGRVLLAGGYNSPSVETYNPNTGAWTLYNTDAGHGDRLAVARLSDGRVLITGGEYGNRVDLFDPSTNSFQAMTPMLYKRMFHSASLLPNGKVLIAGGDDGNTASYTAELYDVAANGGGGGSALVPGSLIVGSRYGATSPLPNGDILLAGGSNPPGDSSGNSTANAQLYGVSLNSFTSLASLLVPRATFPMTLLATGQVLVSGGQNIQGGVGTVLSESELWSNAPGTINVTSSPVGAGFRLVGPGYNQLHTTPFALPVATPGDWTVTWSILLGGYQTPPQETKTLPPGQTIGFTATYKLNLLVSPTSLTFTNIVGNAPSPAQVVQVSSSGAARHVSASTSTNSGGGWLSIAPSSATTPQSFSVSASPDKLIRGLPLGTYTGSVSFSADATWPVTVPVVLNVVLPGRLNLTPPNASPIVGETQQLTAVLTAPDGSPLPNQQIKLTVTGANTFSDKRNTDASGFAIFAYVGAPAGVDSVKATTAINGIAITSNTSTIAWTAPPPPQHLDIIVPQFDPMQTQQLTVGKFGIWEAALTFAGSERQSFGATFGADTCYYGAMDALAQLSGKNIIQMASNQLATGIISAPLATLSTDSILGNILAKSASFVIKLTASDNVPNDTLKFLAENAVGFILTNASSSYLAGGNASSISDKVVRALVNDDGTIESDDTGDNGNSVYFKTAGAPLTSINVGFSYNPYSKVIVGGVRAQCQLPGGAATHFYLVRLPVNSTANVNGPVNVCNGTTHVCKTP